MSWERGPRAGVYAALRPSGGQSGKYLDASGESALGPWAVCGALTPSCKRHPCGIRGCPALGPCPPSQARASRCRASAQSSSQRVRRAVFTCLTQGPVSGLGTAGGRPRRAPGAAWQRCPGAPARSPALPFSPQVWEALSRRAVHPGAPTAVLQVGPCPCRRPSPANPAPPQPQA